MEEKKIEIGKPVTIGQMTIIPVIRYSLHGWSQGSGFFYFGTKQPVYIVAVSPSGKKVFDTSGEEIPFDKFIEETPGIAEALR